jgi:type I restriction enzyme S subunit
MAVDCPSGWSETTVRELVLAHFSGPSPTCDERQVRSAEEWGLLKTTAITWSGWDETAHKVPPETYWGNKRIEVHADDVLITKAGPRHRVAVVAHVSSTRPQLMVSGKMIGLRPDPALVLPQVLAGLLSMPLAQEFLDRRTTGMAESQVNFSNEVLLETPLCLPPMPEQLAIADVLAASARAVAAEQTKVDKLRLVTRGVMVDLLTGRVRATQITDGALA